jgi:hypothetical protein
MQNSQENFAVCRKQTSAQVYPEEEFVRTKHVVKM